LQPATLGNSAQGCAGFLVSLEETAEVGAIPGAQVIRQKKREVRRERREDNNKGKKFRFCSKRFALGA
jgi:hypothetical protein